MGFMHLSVPVMTKEQKLESFTKELVEIYFGSWCKTYFDLIDATPEYRSTRETNRRNEIIAGMEKINGY
jgi:hypothetical protein